MWGSLLEGNMCNREFRGSQLSPPARPHRGTTMASHARNLGITSLPHAHGIHLQGLLVLPLNMCPLQCHLPDPSHHCFLPGSL